MLAWPGAGLTLQVPWRKRPTLGEVTMQDICRRWTDESEGHVSMAVMQRVLQRTFTAFVKAKGDHWLLGLLDMLFFDLNLSIYVSNYVAACLIVVCLEPRFEHLSPVLDLAFAEGRLRSPNAPPQVG